MGRNDSSENIFIMGLVAVAAVIGLIVWKFSTTFGLDMATGGKVLLYMLLLTGITAALLKLDVVELDILLPFVIATLWCCWWPALDYWAAQQSPFPLDTYPDFEAAQPWWAAWYTKLGGVLLVLGIGYGIRAWFRGR